MTGSSSETVSVALLLERWMPWLLVAMHRYFVPLWASVSFLSVSVVPVSPVKPQEAANGRACSSISAFFVYEAKHDPVRSLFLQRLNDYIIS